MTSRVCAVLLVLALAGCGASAPRQKNVALPRTATADDLITAGTLNDKSLEDVDGGPFKPGMWQRSDSAQDKRLADCLGLPDPNAKTTVVKRGNGRTSVGTNGLVVTSSVDVYKSADTAKDVMKALRKGTQQRSNGSETQGRASTAAQGTPTTCLTQLVKESLNVHGLQPRKLPDVKVTELQVGKQKNWSGYAYEVKVEGDLKGHTVVFHSIDVGAVVGASLIDLSCSVPEGSKFSVDTAEELLDKAANAVASKTKSS